ncbi:hypothetical protein [uncultured Lentibacter sp.]|jgi:hypothetical protein|uniref:hypothetical protein n=1 Tax=uncultured Lentibacter sp. TaxID=1659309 RepID=UPI0026232EEC|nr:hypothetical protein [uncultured Lentibacter sp.]
MSDLGPQEAVLEAMLPYEGYRAMLRHIEKRLTSLELSVAAMETERAVSEEKRKFMVARFNQIDTRLDKIDGHIARLVWLIIAAILGGFMSFVMQGPLMPG